MMDVEQRNDGSLIYCLSSGPTLPEWLGERARRNLSKRDEAIRRRIELIQDFQMPSSSSKIAQSLDGRFIMVAGTYPPRVRCYDVFDLTLKFERYLDAAAIDICMLGNDYGKMALLLDNRTICLHAPYGAHESVRIPTFGRAMAYEPTTCELLLAAKGSQVYRLNLEEGRFREPWAFQDIHGNASGSCIAVHPSHALAAVGCDDGVVRFWDNRSPDSMLKPFLTLDVKSATKGYGYADDGNPFTNLDEITCIAHDPSALYTAVGTGSGVVALYDVRSSRPLCITEHKQGLPIHTVKFHPYSGCILSSDEKLVKAWRYKSSKDVIFNDDKSKSTVGSVILNVEGSGKLSHFIMAGDESDPTGDKSGVLLCATDQPKMETYFMPSIGLPPKWCSFLENITEELEERNLTRADQALVQDNSQQESVFENYKFVSQEEVDKLGIGNLVGTPLLRGYMHGFFMDINLYNKVRAVANPFEYEEYRKQKLKSKMEAQRASRIAPKDNNKKKSVAVNADLAERLQARPGDTKSGKVAKQVLSDSRFGSLFTNPDFEIDEGDHAFKLRNPSGISPAARRRNDDVDSDDDDDSDGGAEKDDDVPGFQRLDDNNNDDTDSNGESSSSDDSDEEDGFAGAKVRGEMYQESKKRNKNPDKKRKKVPSSKAIMYEAEDDTAAVGLDSNVEQKRHMTLEQRLSAKAKESSFVSESTQVINSGEQGYSREVTYIPRDARKANTDTNKEEPSKRKRSDRRGVKDLGFKTPFNKHY